MEILNMLVNFILWILRNISQLLGCGNDPIGLFFAGIILILFFMIILPASKIFIKAAF